MLLSSDKRLRGMEMAIETKNRILRSIKCGLVIGFLIS